MEIGFNTEEHGGRGVYPDSKPHLVPVPAAVSINPLCAPWQRLGHLQIEDWDCLSHVSSGANGDDLITLGNIDLGDRHFLPKHLGREWKGEIALNHGEEPASLFRLVVGVGCR